MKDEYLGVNFNDWRNHTIYKDEELNKYTCRLCNKTFNICYKNRHKKTRLHKKLYDDFEDKRYDYVRFLKNKNN